MFASNGEDHFQRGSAKRIYRTSIIRMNTIDQEESSCSVASKTKDSSHGRLEGSKNQLIPGGSERLSRYADRDTIAPTMQAPMKKGARARCLQDACVSVRYARTHARFHEACTHTRVRTHAHTVCRHTRLAKHARDGRQVLCAPLATSPTWPYPFSSPTPSRNTVLTQPTEMSGRFKPNAPRRDAVIVEDASPRRFGKTLPRPFEFFGYSSNLN